MKFMKISVLGSACVGKTTLTKQFLYGRYTECHTPTVEDHYQEFLHFNGEAVSVNIADTSGTFSFPVMQRLLIKNSDGLIIVYEASSLESLRALERILQDVAALPWQKPCVIVRNKVDVSSAADEEGLLAAEDILARYSQLIPFVTINTSCRMNYNVEKVFTTACNLIVRDTLRPRTSSAVRIRLAKQLSL